MTVNAAPSNGTSWDNTATFNYTQSGNTGTQDTNTVSTVYTPPIAGDCDCVALVKTANRNSVSTGDVIRYTIALSVTNAARIPAAGVPLTNFIDTLPSGVVYIGGSAVSGGVALTDTQLVQTGQILTFNGFTLTETGEEPDLEISFNARVISTALGGRLVNSASLEFIGDSNGDGLTTGESTTTLIDTAVVQLDGEPVFDCAELIGRVFEDTNGNGYPDDGERGVPGALLINTQGYNITTDEHGRYHIPCAARPRIGIGSNYIMKLVTHSLPIGFDVTSENPRVVRLTRGKITQLNFGVQGGAQYSHVRFEIAEHAFAPNSTLLVPEMQANMDQLIGVLVNARSSLSLVYTGVTLSQERMAALSRFVTEQFLAAGGTYELPISAVDYSGRLLSSPYGAVAGYGVQHAASGHVQGAAQGTMVQHQGQGRVSHREFELPQAQHHAGKVIKPASGYQLQPQ